MTASARVTNTAVQLQPGHRCHDQILCSRERRDSTALLWIPSRHCPTILQHPLAPRGTRGQSHESPGLLRGAYSKLRDSPGALHVEACFTTRQARPHRRQDTLHETPGLLRRVYDMLRDGPQLLRGVQDVLHDVPELHRGVDDILHGISAYIATRMERLRTPRLAQDTRLLDTANAS